jgi:peroxiredoxin
MRPPDDELAPAHRAQGDNRSMSGIATPVPSADGAYDHVLGSTVPQLDLPSTAGGRAEVCDPLATFTVLFLYPMTGTPGKPLPEGWMDIPGAFGCTPQACAYRDQLTSFEELDATVHGISTQTPAEQLEFSERERIPYPLLSDADLRLTTALRLPTFEAGGKARLKRASLIVRERRVIRVLYPVTDPAGNALETLTVLHQAAGEPKP